VGGTELQTARRGFTIVVVDEMLRVKEQETFDTGGEQPGKKG
jgi:hypothetical protein